MLRRRLAAALMQMSCRFGKAGTQDSHQHSHTTSRVATRRLGNKASACPAVLLTQATYYQTTPNCRMLLLKTSRKILGHCTTAIADSTANLRLAPCFLPDGNPFAVPDRARLAAIQIYLCKSSQIQNKSSQIGPPSQTNRRLNLTCLLELTCVSHY